MGCMGYLTSLLDETKFAILKPILRLQHRKQFRDGPRWDPSFYQADYSWILLHLTSPGQIYTLTNSTVVTLAFSIFSHVSDSFLILIPPLLSFPLPPWPSYSISPKHTVRSAETLPVNTRSQPQTGRPHSTTPATP
ncbi:Chain A Histidyl-Trna Synthetase (Apo) [Perkinsela sp. CCAP 1560/4]|nr:Chain A Histidyl-Trna Synthetase (Apo) [Perkinsela sp. CCAP 1560/4]|eukprot:KNH07745.1 Chain A Histidyl-Trna Synthetase (Apo) [Perkinsela sp. CCAP 1560/4]